MSLQPTQNTAPLKLILTDKAQRRVNEIGAWLQSLPFGETAAIRFLETLNRVLPELCLDIAERLATGNNMPRPDEEATIAFSRPAYRFTFTTASGGRRKNGRQQACISCFTNCPTQKR